MQQLFPREGEDQPRLRFPEFRDAGEWEETELGKCLGTVIDYQGKPPPKAVSGVPLITAKNVRFGWLDMTAEFLFQSLLGAEMQETIDFHSTGSTANGIKSSVFVTLRFRPPKVAEQQLIASSLRSLDAKITAETQKLETLKNHKKGRMQPLFPALEEVVA